MYDTCLMSKDKKRNEFGIKKSCPILKDLSKPPSLRNNWGVCMSISLLQMIIASPTLIMMIYENNYYENNVCQILEDINFSELKVPSLLPQNIERLYLVHEMMMLKGLYSSHKNKGLNCDEHEERNFESERRRKSSGIVENLYKLIIANNNKYHFLFHDNFTEPLTISPEPKRQKWYESARAYKTIRSLICCVDKFREKTPINQLLNISKSVMIKFIDNNYLRLFSINVLSLMFFILYSNPKHFAVILAEQNGETKQFIIDNELNMKIPTVSSYIFTYFPHIRFVQFTIDRDLSVYFTNTTNLNITSYRHSLNTPSFPQLIRETSKSFQMKVLQLLKNYDTPNNLMTESEYLNYRAIDQPFELILSEHSLALIKSFFKDLFHSSKIEQTTNSIESLTKNLPIYYRRNLMKLPQLFWCKNIPCEQQLFKDFDVNYRATFYKTLAILLVEDNIRYTFSDLREAKFENEVDFKSVFQKRKTTLREITMESIPNQNLNSNFHAYKLLNKLIEIIAHNETMFSKLQIHNFKLNKDPPRNEFRTINSPGGHSVIVVKSLLTEKWWLITNSAVDEIQNLRTFVTEINQKNVHYFPQGIFWENSEKHQKSINILYSILK
ncbi:hypothetical protein SNEBB_000410 [Seison nebaliae]|nr:hypothetical protein SNEBB_000410 [Seison nebaliae]